MLFLSQDAGLRPAGFRLVAIPKGLERKTGGRGTKRSLALDSRRGFAAGASHPNAKRLAACQGSCPLGRCSVPPPRSGLLPSSATSAQVVLMRIYRTLRLRGLDPTKTITAALQTYLQTGEWPPFPGQHLADG